ncbi:MAG: hypothetical protein WAS07_14990 [Micropruina sp.]|nr:hypothetical protein [Micropruina sp.]
MDPFLIAVLVAGLVLGGGAWWGKRRRSPVGEQEGWPSEPDGWPSESAAASGDELPPQPFDRSFLENRSRVLNVRGWDDSPDGEASGEPVADDLPATFDRDYLRSKKPPDQPAE